MNRVTTQKQQILDALKPGYHPTAEELLEKIRKTEPDFSRATLYRNLSSFCEEGKITKLSFMGGADRFEIVSTPHYHVVCKKCGRIENVNIKQLSMPSSIMEFDVVGHDLTFFGYCPKCKSKVK